MRVGIITQYYFPLTGGISEHVYHLADHLRQLGHEPTVITSRCFGGNGSYGQDVVRLGWNMRMPIPINGSFGCFNVGYQIGAKIQELCRERQFDLLHLHSPAEPILPWVVLGSATVPVVGTFHTMYTKLNLPYEIFGRQFRKYVEMLSGRIAVSEAAKEYNDRYFPGEYAIIPNGVDLARFHPGVEPIKKFNDDTFNILFVGRMDPRKGVKFLLQAFPMIHKQHPDCRLIIVGDGWLKEYYKMYIPDGLEKKVFFEGYVAREDLPRYYAAADVFCAPATGGESFGIVLIEAMASGKPIVASNILGYREVVTDGQDGILVPPNDPAAISEAVLTLIKDHRLREAMGQQGLLKAPQYSWGSVAEQIVQCYRRVLDKTGKTV